MWKRKLGLTLGVLLLAGALCACGGETADKESTGGSAKQSSEKDSGEDAGSSEKQGDEKTSEDGKDTKEEEKGWETREVAEPTFEEMIINEVELAEGVVVQMATTPFDLNTEKLYEIANRHPIVTDNYVLFDGKDVMTYSTTWPEGPVMSAYVTEGLAGEKKDDPDPADLISSPFRLQLVRDTGKFENWNKLNLTLAAMSMTLSRQEEIYALLTDLVGAEIAEYLVYQKNTEKNLMEAEFTTAGGAKYTLERDMTTAGRAEFSISVTNPGFKQKYVDFDGGYEPLTDCISYNFEQFSGGLFPDFHVEDKDTYMEEHMKHGVKKHLESLFDGGIYTEMQQTDTRKSYFLHLSFDSVQEGLEKKQNYPLHGISVHIFEENGEIDSFTFSYNVDMQTRANDYELEDIIDSVKAQIQYLFPELDLSSVTAANLEEEEKLHFDVPVEIMGEEKVYWINIYDHGTWEVKLSY